jgi:hypothetical protein
MFSINNYRNPCYLIFSFVLFAELYCSGWNQEVVTPLEYQLLQGQNTHFLCMCCDVLCSGCLWSRDQWLFDAQMCGKKFLEGRWIWFPKYWVIASILNLLVHKCTFDVCKKCTKKVLTQNTEFFGAGTF